MFKIIISPIKGYSRSISYSNRLVGLLKMIFGNNPGTFNNGIFEIIINCSESNLINLIDLLKSAMKKQFLDVKSPFYSITWEKL